jgi:hypothetical protein
MNLAKVGLVSLAAVLATGCYGRGGPDAFVAGAIFTSAIISVASSHAEQERQEAWEREQDEAPLYPAKYVVNPQVAFEAPPPPAPPGPPSFDAKAARNALAAVDLAECRTAGAPRGYGHAKATVNPSGDISKVVIEEPAGMPPAATRCIGNAIGRVTVPEFSGSFVTVGTTFFVP